MELMRSKNPAPLRRVLVGVTIAVALLTAAIWTGLDKRRLHTIRMETPSGTILVEVADTPATRSAGLSNRESLSGIDVDGLLLKWDAP
jgi:hypothetical protein